MSMSPRSGWFVLTCLIGFALVLPPLSAGETADGSLDRFVRKFNRLVERGDVERAQRVAERAARRFPANPVAKLMHRHGQLTARQVADEPEIRPAGHAKPIPAVEKSKTWEGIQRPRPLEQSVSLHFDKKPLRQVLGHLAATTGATFAIDESALNEEGVRSDVAVSIHVNDVPVRTALAVLFTPLPLAYHVEDGVVKITGTTRAAGPLEVRTYPVADLVVPIPGMPKANAKPTARPEPARPAVADFDELSELITSTVQPNSWCEVGGEGSIRPFETTLSLVVRQTKSAHDEIRDLLQQLRELQKVQVSLEMRFLEVPETFFEQIGIDVDFHVARAEKPVRTLLDGQNTPSAYYLTDDVQYFPAPTDGPAPVFQASIDDSAEAVANVKNEQVLLSDREVKQLMETVQRCDRANVLSAPKVTLFNGQHAEVQCGHVPPQPGDFDIDVTAVVSADRRQIRAEMTYATPGDPGSKPKNFHFTAADGQSVLVNLGTRTTEARHERGVPVLSQVPYVSRLFRNTGIARETTHKLLLVTPRGIIAEEEEELLGVE